MPGIVSDDFPVIPHIILKITISESLPLSPFIEKKMRNRELSSQVVQLGFRARQFDWRVFLLNQWFILLLKEKTKSKLILFLAPVESCNSHKRLA